VAGAAAVLGALALATPAWGKGHTVCPTGCKFTKIQPAIDAASPGATITIGTGSYFENLVVNKPLTLTGGSNGTVIYPALNEPTCKTGSGSLCGGAASSIILVEASNVTISNLRLDGDSPHLKSPVVVGGAEIEARNGIITNHLKGVPYTNLVVSKVNVENVYLRGIYASTSGGTFKFMHDQVTNVQAEEASVAMFAFENSGLMERNKVSEANDAISANWSKGTQFLRNTIKNSGSGVHTDNNGGAGGTADAISGNKVSSCKPDGYGVFVLAPYVATTVEANKIKGCAVGLAAFGSQPEAATIGPTFANNKVSVAGAVSTEPGGTVGAYLTTDLVGFGHANVTANLTHNQFEGFATGMIVTQTKPTHGDTAGSQATVTAHNNSFATNLEGANGETGTVVEAQNNWWGCPQGPNMSPKCDSAVGTVQFTPWLSSKP
jgi:nitrous oxidase accessory protein NosD